MTDQKVTKFLAEIESLYKRLLVTAWERDPENFRDYVAQLEEIIDLRRKLRT